MVTVPPESINTPDGMKLIENFIKGRFNMILDDIVAKKKITLEKSDYKFDAKRLYKAMEKPVASFYDAMAKEGLSIIGEVKKASPSRGLIKPDFHPVEIS